MIDENKLQELESQLASTMETVRQIRIDPDARLDPESPFFIKLSTQLEAISTIHSSINFDEPPPKDQH